MSSDTTLSDDDDGANDDDDEPAAAALFVLRLGFGILLYANRQTGRQSDGGKFVKGLSKMYMRKREKSFVV